MSDDSGIDAADELEFGEVRERLPAHPPLPPDRDGHLATAWVGRGPSREASATSEVFVELETFLDMQQHAAEDTSIELGGLLLGRRGEHPDGTPWVMICDSLRARHYQATRGSFRFTHETWADLNQQRSELPESSEIVGWYHTHPGWGIFLSDQDVFICDHFFAHPDDVALVIDPTSGDTGLFVRRGSPSDRPPQRLGYYHLYAHRKRAAELSAWASFFSGVGTMSNPPAVFPSSHSPPVIVTTGADPTGVGKHWIALAAGMLGAQLAILIAILVAVSDRTSPGGAAHGSAAMELNPGARDATQIREAVVDELLGKIAIDGPEGAARSWRETALANEQLRAANLGLLSRVDALTADLQVDRRRLQQTNQKLKMAAEQLAAVEGKLTALTPAAAAEEGVRFEWRAVLSGAAGGVVLGWLIGSLSPRRPTPRKNAAAPQSESPR